MVTRGGRLAGRLWMVWWPLRMARKVVLAEGHSCITAKGVLVMAQSHKRGVSAYVENYDKSDIRGYCVVSG